MTGLLVLRPYEAAVTHPLLTWDALVVLVLAGCVLLIVCAAGWLIETDRRMRTERDRNRWRRRAYEAGWRP